jgi:hypothetical protein
MVYWYVAMCCSTFGYCLKKIICQLGSTIAAYIHGHISARIHTSTRITIHKSSAVQTQFKPASANRNSLYCYHVTVCPKQYLELPPKLAQLEPLSIVAYMQKS